MEGSVEGSERGGQCSRFIGNSELEAEEAVGPYQTEMERGTCERTKMIRLAL